MKSIITMLLLACTIVCFGQEKKGNSSTVNTFKETNNEDNRILLRQDAPSNKVISVLMDNGHGRINFSPYEQGEMEDFEFSKVQAIKFLKARDSLQGIFLQKLLIRNKVDLSRLSQHPDSLKITLAGIEYILKPIKK